MNLARVDPDFGLFLILPRRRTQTECRTAPHQSVAMTLPIRALSAPATAEGRQHPRQTRRASVACFRYVGLTNAARWDTWRPCNGTSAFEARHTKTPPGTDGVLQAKEFQAIRPSSPPRREPQQPRSRRLPQPWPHRRPRPLPPSPRPRRQLLP